MEDKKLYNEFLETLETVAVCPYCLVDNQLDPPLLCCGEVHAELAFENIFGKVFLESDLDAAFEDWLEKRPLEDRETLISAFKTLLERLSFYNACESGYSREAGKRQKTIKDLKGIASELMILGIDPEVLVFQHGGLIGDAWKPE